MGKTIDKSEYPTTHVVAQYVAYNLVNRTEISKGITAPRLFKAVYGEPYKARTDHGEARMYVLKQAIHHCRHNMYPFVVPYRATDKDKVKYFVPLKRSDMKYYIATLKTAKKGIDKTIQKRIPYWLKNSNAHIAQILIAKKTGGV